jgi:dihydropteroate synthase
VRLLARGHVIEFQRRPLIMGIVNLSADSFSGDGLADTSAAVEKASSLARDGAEIIDIGAESARTNRPAISESYETDRLCEFVTRWNQSAIGSQGSVLLSINTWRPSVARAVLQLGGDILNDIGALPTDENARTCAETGAALLIMHTVGEPKVPHTHVAYDDVMERLDHFFAQKIALAESAGVPRDSIILDPGIDFAKQRDDNLRIFRELERLHRFQRPILLPVSRKTVIGDVLDIPATERDAGTIACLVAGQTRGAQIFRVHNVRAAAQSVKIIHALREFDVSAS